jgi:DNA-binding transcriptional regulator YhcF (GntR family)/methanogenic corrinoid protein MtbC1
MQLDKQHPTPVYLQLKEMLRNQIEQGLYHTHQKLPSERDLCQLHNLSRMTARRALKELVNEGLAYTRVGKGTFVGSEPHSLSNIELSRDGNSKTFSFAEHTTRYYQQRLVERLLSFDCVGSEQVIKETLALYPVEVVATEIFPEVIQKLEQRCQRGDACILAKNYAVTTLRSHLIAMVNATTTVETGPKVLLACAPEDLDEIGLLLLALILRRRGFRVIYLGPNVTTVDFHQVIEAAQPQLVCFTATTPDSVPGLSDLSQRWHRNLGSWTQESGGRFPKTVFAFCGRVFVKNPSLISQIAGLYLGDTIESAVSKVEGLFSQKKH